MRLSARLCAVAALAGLAYFAAGSISTAQVQPVTAGQVIISELRYRGPNGIRDEFVEIYNNTDSPITVQAIDASAGWGLAASDGNINATFCVIPNGTVIPARGHFLCANLDPDFGSGYSLSQYPSGSPSLPVAAVPTAAAQSPEAAAVLPPQFLPTSHDAAYTIFDDVPDGFGIALFTTASTANQNAATWLDAFGFTQSPALFKEGNGFPTIPSTNNEHTLYRDLRQGKPKDTNDNAADFRFVATTGSIQTQLNGAPGPENLRSPVVNNDQISLFLLDPAVSSASLPNRERTSNVEPNADLGTLLVRRRFQNNTGQNVTRLRFRIVNFTTRGTPPSECGGTPCADLRALTSDDADAGDPGHLVATSAGSVTVRGVRLEDNPPITPGGGGLNSSLSADYINMATPLLPGNSVNIEFKLGIMAHGPFRFIINIEAQTAPAGPVIVAPTNRLSAKSTVKGVRKVPSAPAAKTPATRAP
ncbi:MAG TPA: lamin tail domain-containing protein, partial [Pyrinomonadaceae bacterium]|nr:lamin tail domain-containing protein [Pyrinomonadaceae bacterium]